MKKICTIVGARPQFIKAAVVSRAFRAMPDRIRESIVHTGQHYDHGMSDVFFSELDIPRPDHHLGVGGGSHGQNTGRMLERIESVLLESRPDFVLVYGDTDSTLAGALAAAKLHVPVAHVEAGLRSFNRRMPEEINRILTDHASDLLFTPTSVATAHLATEGVPETRISQVGDVMYDAALFYSALADQCSDAIARFGLQPGAYALATIHRAENTDDYARISAILEGIGNSRLPVLLPLHPRTRNRIDAFGLDIPSNVRIVAPIGYLDMVALQRSAAVIATDSGGMQKEAYFHRVPCVTLRDETEWVELIDANANTLVGADANRIARAMNEFRPDFTHTGNLYGDGNAGANILKRLTDG